MRRGRIRLCRWTVTDDGWAMELSARVPGGEPRLLGRIWHTSDAWGWETADGRRGGMEPTREAAMRALEAEARL